MDRVLIIPLKSVNGVPFGTKKEDVHAHNMKHVKVYDYDCSDLEPAKFLTIATDFEWNEEDTSWISKSKQIAIYCQEDKFKIDSITFGCPGYYDFFDEE